MAPSGTTGSPCGACKFLRRKCASYCIFAPYFSSEQGPARFAAIHKVFGASNVSKLLLHIPARDRCEAVVSIAYEAQARIRDPVYETSLKVFMKVSGIYATILQCSWMFSVMVSYRWHACKLSYCKVKAQLAQNAMNSHTMYGQWEQNLSGLFPSIPNDPISPQSSLESVEVELNSGDSDTMNIQEMLSIENFAFHGMRPCDGDLGELQAIALRMMRN